MADIKKIIEDLRLDDSGRLTFYHVDKRNVSLSYIEDSVKLRLTYGERLMNEITYSLGHISSVLPLDEYAKETVEYGSTVSRLYEKIAAENAIDISPFDHANNVDLLKHISDVIENRAMGRGFDDPAYEPVFIDAPEEELDQEEEISLTQTKEVESDADEEPEIDDIKAVEEEIEEEATEEIKIQGHGIVSRTRDIDWAKYDNEWNARTAAREAELLAQKYEQPQSSTAETAYTESPAPGYTSEEYKAPEYPREEYKAPEYPREEYKAPEYTREEYSAPEYASGPSGVSEYKTSDTSPEIQAGSDYAPEDFKNAFSEQAEAYPEIKGEAFTHTEQPLTATDSRFEDIRPEASFGQEIELTSDDITKYRQEAQLEGHGYISEQQNLRYYEQKLEEERRRDEEALESGYRYNSSTQDATPVEETSSHTQTIAHHLDYSGKGEDGVVLDAIRLNSGADLDYSDNVYAENAEVKNTIEESKKSSAPEPADIHTSSPDVGSKILNTATHGSSFYISNEFLERTDNYSSDRNVYDDNIREKFALLDQKEENEEKFRRDNPGYGKGSYAGPLYDYEEAPEHKMHAVINNGGDDAFPVPGGHGDNYSNDSSVSSSESNEGSHQKHTYEAFKHHPDMSSGMSDDAKKSYKETIGTLKFRATQFLKDQNDMYYGYKTSNNYVDYIMLPVDLVLSAGVNAARTAAVNSAVEDLKKAGLLSQNVNDISRAELRRIAQENGLKGIYGSNRTIDLMVKGHELTANERALIKEELNARNGFNTSRFSSKSEQQLKDLLAGSSMDKSKADALQTILAKRNDMLSSGGGKLTKAQFDEINKLLSANGLTTADLKSGNALLRGARLNKTDVETLKREIARRSTGAPNSQFSKLSTETLKKMHQGSRLNQKQIAILKASKNMNSFKDSRFGRWGRKNKGVKTLKKAARKVYFKSLAQDTTLSFYTGFVYPKTVMGRVAKQATKIGFRTVKGTAILGFKAARLTAWGAGNVLSRVNPDFKAWSDNRHEKKMREKLNKKHHKDWKGRLRDSKNRTIKTVKKNIKGATFNGARHMLGSKNFHTAMKTVNSVGGKFRAASAAAAKIKGAAQAAKTKVLDVVGRIGKAFNAVKAALMKYILIPAVIILLLLAILSCLQGPLIAALTVFDQKDDLVKQVQLQNEALNDDFDNKLQVTTMLVEDIGSGITDNELYEVLSGRAAHTIAFVKNSVNKAKELLNNVYGTSFETEDEIDPEDIITYIDEYRISCRNFKGEEVPSVDLNNDGTILSMAAVYTMQDIIGKDLDNLDFKLQFLTYTKILWNETHRYSVIMTEKGPCEYNGVSWADNHDFVCKNGHWGECTFESTPDDFHHESKSVVYGKYKTGTHNGIDEGAIHKYWDPHDHKETDSYEDSEGNSHTRSYWVGEWKEEACDGSDVYWHCPGHVDVETKVVIGSLALSEDGKWKIDEQQREADTPVFAMDLFGGSELISDLSYALNFKKNLILTELSAAAYYITDALGWEPLSEGFWADTQYFFERGVNPETRWKGWFDEKEWEGYWTRVRLYFNTGESKNKQGETGWETIYNYEGTPHLIFSGLSTGTGGTTSSGNASKAEIEAALENYSLTSFQESLIHFAEMAADAGVPYYWGGTATNADLGTTSHFGGPVAADYKGRTKRGLDCSGFVQWCYRSAGKNDFARYSTETMVTSFTRTSKEALIPGDVIVYNTGGKGHVKLFCGYNDGYYYFIESAGQPCNQVIYSKCTDFSYIPMDMSAYQN